MTYPTALLHTAIRKHCFIASHCGQSFCESKSARKAVDSLYTHRVDMDGTGVDTFCNAKAPSKILSENGTA